MSSTTRKEKSGKKRYSSDNTPVDQVYQEDDEAFSHEACGPGRLEKRFHREDIEIGHDRSEDSFLRILMSSLMSMKAEENMFAQLLPASSELHNSGAETSPKRLTESEKPPAQKQKTSRWSNANDKQLLPHSVLPVTMSKDQEELYLLHVQLVTVDQKLANFKLGTHQIPVAKRSASPDPIYDAGGRRINTRESRALIKLEEQRHQLIRRIMLLDPNYKPPACYRPEKCVFEKVPLPQEEHPNVNFIGLLIGPRGNTMKAIEMSSGARIIIRGKGSVHGWKVHENKSSYAGSDEPLHAYITAGDREAVAKAVAVVKDMIHQVLESPTGCIDLRVKQLKELAQLNGTLRYGREVHCANCGSGMHTTRHCHDKPKAAVHIICSVCGEVGHLTRDCRSKQTEHVTKHTKYDEEYENMLKQLG